MGNPFIRQCANAHEFSSPEIEQMTDDSLLPVLTSSGVIRHDPNMDETRLRNIRLLAHIRNTKTGAELRQRFISSMENLFQQMTNAAAKQQAQIIIMTANRT